MKDNYIDDFLQGNLDDDALREFQKLLDEDPTLAADVRLQQHIGTALKEQDVIDFEQKLTSLFDEKPATAPLKEQGRIVSFRRVLSIAAGFAILVTAGWWSMTQNNTLTPEDAFAQNFDFPTTIEAPKLRSGAASTPTPDEGQEQSTDVPTLKELWKETETNYKAENYNQALAIMSGIRQLDPLFEQQSKSEYYYRLGLIQAKNQNYEGALQAFNQVGNREYKETVAWKKALLQLQIPEQYLQGIKDLEIISKSNHPKKEEAKSILDKL